MWKPPKATGTQILVVPDEAVTETEGGILLGRDVEQMTAVVVSMSEWAVVQFPEITLGARIVWQRDKMRQFVWEGRTVCAVNLRTHCPRCRCELRSDEVVGVQG